MKKYFNLQKISLPLMIFILAVTFLFFALQGCITIKARPSPDVQELLCKETGFNLAYYGLKNESQEVLKRTEGAIKTAISLTETTDVNEMVDLIIKYISEMPQFKTGVSEYEALITSATRILKELLDVNLDITENQQTAVRCVNAFLNGALEGIEGRKQTGATLQTYNTGPWFIVG